MMHAQSDALSAILTYLNFCASDAYVRTSFIYFNINYLSLALLLIKCSTCRNLSEYHEYEYCTTCQTDESNLLQLNASNNLTRCNLSFDSRVGRKMSDRCDPCIVTNCHSSQRDGKEITSAFKYLFPSCIRA